MLNKIKYYIKLGELMEKLDIVDEKNNLTGKIETRKLVHEKGLWHRHVGAWIMNKNGELLFQKRVATKPINANKWARTGGHVDAGEETIHAVQRETKEEIGVNIPAENWELISIDKYIKENDNNHHFTYNYFTIVDYELEDYTIQKEELSDLKYMSLEEMKILKEKQDENYTFTNWDNFYEMLEILNEKRNKIIKNK